MINAPARVIDPRTVGTTHVQVGALRVGDVLRLHGRWKGVEHVFDRDTTDEDIAKLYEDDDPEHALLTRALSERHGRVVVAVVNDERSREYDVAWTLEELHELDLVEIQVPAVPADARDTGSEAVAQRRTWVTAHVRALDVVQGDTALLRGNWRDVADVWTWATLDAAAGEFGRDSRMVESWRKYLDATHQHVIVRYYIEQPGGADVDDDWVPFRLPELVAVQVPATPAPVPTPGLRPYYP